MADAKAFQKQLAAFSRKVDVAARDAVRGIALEVGSRIIDRTPVDTGRARGGWQTSIGAAAPGPPPDRSPDEARAELEATVQRVDLGDEVHISNAVDYIGVLEDGSSAQAPQGMVKATLDEVAGIADRIASQVKL